MRLVERVAMPLLVIIKSVGITNPQVCLLQRHMQGNRRQQLGAKARLAGGRDRVIIVVKPAQSRGDIPEFWDGHAVSHRVGHAGSAQRHQPGRDKKILHNSSGCVL